jgi:uncharacterized protein YjbI with pentapeptide repeats
LAIAFSAAAVPKANFVALSTAALSAPALKSAIPSAAKASEAAISATSFSAANLLAAAISATALSAANLLAPIVSAHASANGEVEALSKPVSLLGDAFSNVAAMPPSQTGSNATSPSRRPAARCSRRELIVEASDCL